MEQKSHRNPYDCLQHFQNTQGKTKRGAIAALFTLCTRHSEMLEILRNRERVCVSTSLTLSPHSLSPFLTLSVSHCLSSPSLHKRSTLSPATSPLHQFSPFTAGGSNFCWTGWSRSGEAKLAPRNPKLSMKFVGDTCAAEIRPHNEPVLPVIFLTRLRQRFPDLPFRLLSGNVQHSEGVRGFPTNEEQEQGSASVHQQSLSSTSSFAEVLISFRKTSQSSEVVRTVSRQFQCSEKKALTYRARFSCTASQLG